MTDIVDESKLAFAGMIGPTDVYTQVSDTGYELSVGNHTNGGSVENDVIEMLAKDANGSLQRRTGYQFGRIGGQSTAGQDIQVGSPNRGRPFSAPLCSSLLHPTLRRLRHRCGSGAHCP